MKSPPKKWLFRVAAVVLIPILALAILEGALRIGGYGYSTRLFEKAQVNGKEYLLNNESFSRRFFPPALSRWPSPLMIEPVKPQNTYRIFIFGESAAQGDPEPGFGAGRYLEELLKTRYPGVNFEVVNVAITAINSHVIVPIARECADYQGDLWIIYMGNNEMIGPFGAATVFGAKAPPWPAVRLNLAIQQTRVGQLLMDLESKLKTRHEGPQVWGGLQMFLGNQLSPDDPRKFVVYKNFQRNLQDIIRAGHDSGAAVLLSTVAVNLKDCPPFASVPAGKTFGCAAVEYGNGQDLMAHGDIPTARQEFQKACDDDALPFRADSHINGIIRDTVQAMASPNLVLCDAASVMPEPRKIPGQETFYEHVHFNFDGNYRLAMLWAAKAESLLPDNVKTQAKGAWASQEVCEARLGLTDWNRGDVFNSVLQRYERPPLDSQPNNEQRKAALTAQMDQLFQNRTPAAEAKARVQYSDAIAAAPGDYVLHENFGDFLELTGDIKQAAQQWKQACDLMPRNPSAFLTEGQLLEKEGDLPAAREALRQAVALHPQYTEAWLELGKLDAAQNNLDAALQNYRHAAELQPNDSQAYLYMGKALSLRKRTDESVQNFRHALELDRANWEAHYALGGELGMHGQIAEAKTEFQEVIRLQPKFAMGHLNLGVALLKLNDADGARQQFQETLRLDPSNKSARNYLAAAGAKP